MLALHPEVEKRGTFGPWALVDRYAKRGIIKGYILYRLDKSPGGSNAYRPGMDCSVNVATSLAGLLDGIIVDEELENEAKRHGLKSGSGTDLRPNAKLKARYLGAGGFSARPIPALLRHHQHAHQRRFQWAGVVALPA